MLAVCTGRLSAFLKSFFVVVFFVLTRDEIYLSVRNPPIVPTNPDCNDCAGEGLGRALAEWR